MRAHARVHHAATDAGGNAPNVVQAPAAVRYLIRARELDELLQSAAQVRKIAEGATLITGTWVSSRVLGGDASLEGNTPLEEAMQVEIERLGPRVPPTVFSASCLAGPPCTLQASTALR